MATSRTGTTRWKHLATAAKRKAQTAGQTHCPICHRELNYRQGRTPTSAEADHITPHSRGGTDTADNIRIICRQCNQSRGNGLRRPRPQRQARDKQPRTTITNTTTSNTW